MAVKFKYCRIQGKKLAGMIRQAIFLTDNGEGWLARFLMSIRGSHDTRTVFCVRGKMILPSHTLFQIII